MPTFHALVDALTGTEAAVGERLRALPRLAGVAPCKDGNYDFLVRFEAASFDVVDDFLQTHVRAVPDVASVHVVTGWDDHSAAARQARDALAAAASKR